MYLPRMTEAHAPQKIKARLYLRDARLREGANVTLQEAAAHYLIHTLRAKPGEWVALFNGRDGEWAAELTRVGKREADARVARQLKPQRASPPVGLVFAPVKNEKIDFLVKRAVELGVSDIWPVFTRYTIVSRVNEERLMSNAVEAAEQCGRLDVPAIHAPQKLERLLSAWPADITLLHCDESGQGEALKQALPALSPARYAVLIGPEGGFSPEERGILRGLPYIKPVSLGPRILRAETAALAALACVQAWLGDWDEQPSFTASSSLSEGCNGKLSEA